MGSLRDGFTPHQKGFYVPGISNIHLSSKGKFLKPRFVSLGGEFTLIERNEDFLEE